MHAFDLDTFEGDQIVVQEARAGEKLVALDGEERDLEVSDLVYHCRGQTSSPWQVLWGQATEIFGNLLSVVLEAAVF